MLLKEAVDQSTLELLIQIQKKEYLKGFYLVGGTALALIMGHRKSIDIDLFSNFSFDAVQMLDNLSADFSFDLFFSANNTIKGSINLVKVDILAHRYPLVCEPVILENISMLSVEDIIAMKLNAISVSGQRVKDFIDIYYLLEKYSIEEMLGFYKKKYAQYNEVNVLKSLCWFEDVDLSDWPVLLKNPKLTWGTIKKKIKVEIESFLKK
ncbi:MAG: nucleotidyl transferase AbiEii/AbiGii toxin family protein [Bacteroidota bacterium]